MIRGESGIGVVAILGATWFAGAALGFLMLRVGMRAWMAVLGVACFIGSVFGLLAVYVAVGRNTQGAYIDHETGAVDYLALCSIFLSWLLVLGVPAGLAFTFLVWAFRGFVNGTTGAVSYLGLANMLPAWLAAVSAATGLVLMLLVWSWLRS